MNLVRKPDETRYRKIYTSNESFQKIDKLKGAHDLLFSVGFQKGNGCLEWLPDGSADQESTFLPKLKEGMAILSVLKPGIPNMKDAALNALAAHAN